MDTLTKSQRDPGGCTPSSEGGACKCKSAECSRCKVNETQHIKTGHYSWRNATLFTDTLIPVNNIHTGWYTILSWKIGSSQTWINTSIETTDAGFENFNKGRIYQDISNFGPFQESFYAPFLHLMSIKGGFHVSSPPQSVSKQHQRQDCLFVNG